MKPLKDLKDEILANKLNHFYVFYGQDFGLRKHYIDRIQKSYGKKQLVDSVKIINDSLKQGSLFKTNAVKIVYNDLDILDAKSEYISNFIKRVTSDCVILVYEEEYPNSTLFKEFEEYITHFPRVNDDIAEEFVEGEIKLSVSSRKELASNCSNDYNLICLEADKIRHYAKSKNISEQSAYEELSNQNQLVVKPEPFSVDEMMNDILIGDFKSLAYWHKLITTYYPDSFFIYLNGIFNSFLIAYLIVKHGRYEGSNKAYELNLPWNRTKAIRELIIPYDADSLLEYAYEVACLDEKVKTGKLQQSELLDYFMCSIL